MMIFVVCLLTVLIETPFLVLFGYRSREALQVIICTNIVSNLLLNLFVCFVMPEISWGIYLLEALVVLGEYLLYALAFGHSMRLFLLTFAANCLSYGIGLLIF